MLDVRQLEAIDWSWVLELAKQCALAGLVAKLPSGFEDSAEELLQDFLVQPPPVGDESAFFEKLVAHSWNRREGPNVVHANLLCRERFSEVLCHYDPTCLHHRYPRFEDWRQLRQDLVEAGAIAEESENRRWWETVPKAIVSGAAFVAEGLDLRRRNDADAALGLIYRIEASVHGYGLALACDLAKEAGLVDCVKPDIHIKNNFEIAGLVCSSSFDIVEAGFWVRGATGTSCYTLDKLLWLIGSGRFHDSEHFEGNLRCLFDSIESDPRRGIRTLRLEGTQACFESRMAGARDMT